MAKIRGWTKIEDESSLGLRYSVYEHDDSFNQIHIVQTYKQYTYDNNKKVTQVKLNGEKVVYTADKSDSFIQQYEEAFRFAKRIMEGKVVL